MNSITKNHLIKLVDNEVIYDVDVEEYPYIKLFYVNNDVNEVQILDEFTQEEADSFYKKLDAIKRSMVR